MVSGFNVFWFQFALLIRVLLVERLKGVISWCLMVIVVRLLFSLALFLKWFCWNLVCYWSVILSW